jgi:hypothetical protein
MEEYHIRMCAHRFTVQEEVSVLMTRFYANNTLISHFSLQWHIVLGLKLTESIDYFRHITWIKQDASVEKAGMEKTVDNLK